MSANIFISYRREDSSGHAGRLFDSLSARFGQERIFMDIDSIGPGADFEQVIESTLESSKVVLVVIGREWITVTDEAGQRRLENPGDFVRMEVAAALKRSDLVIPILVQGTSMPRTSDLPPDLASLARRNAWELSDARWSYDLSRLCNAIQQVVDQTQQPAEASADTRLAQGSRSNEPGDQDLPATTDQEPRDADLPRASDRSDTSVRAPQVAMGASLLLATLVFVAGLLLPVLPDTGETMLHWGWQEPVGVALLALLLAGAAIRGLAGAPLLAGGAFGLGLASFLMRLVVALKTSIVHSGSLSSPGTLVTLLGIGSFFVIGAVWAYRLSAPSGGRRVGFRNVGEGGSGIATRTAALSAALLGIALRTESMSLPLRPNHIALAQREHLSVGLPFFIATCIVAVLVLLWLLPFRDGFLACVIGFGVQVLLRLIFPPVAKGGGAGGLADQILWICLGALLVGGVIRALLERRLVRDLDATDRPTVPAMGLRR
jgi:hypothetical protein